MLSFLFVDDGIDDDGNDDDDDHVVVVDGGDNDDSYTHVDVIIAVALAKNGAVLCVG